MRWIRPFALGMVLLSMTACQGLPPMLQAGAMQEMEQSAANTQELVGAERAEEAMLAQFSHPEAIVTTDWLADHLRDADVRIVDVRWLGQEDYDAAHIPGAVYADLFLDLMVPDAKFASVAPSAESFSDTMQRLGIDNDTVVVAYDTMGGAMGGARLWWLLHYYGHEDVKLLNGGWTKWVLEGRPTESGTITPEAGTYMAGEPHKDWRATIDEVEQAVADADVALIDALTWEEFTGEIAHTEPIRDGHIPTAKNLPAPDLLDSNSMALLPREELSQQWASMGLEDAQEIITYCEAGVFSALDFFVLYQLGQENVKLYETSLMEWGVVPSYPMEEGPGR